ncbi:MAG: hypothetical protein K2I53_02155 [Lachnospiraceae bacterium]|nr:hypothetical protein [Lachnospiraceae bacterium]
MIKTNAYQSPTGAYRYDFTDAEDYQKFVQIFGDEAQLKKYPQIQKAAAKTAGVDTASKENSYRNNASWIILEGSIAEIKAIGAEDSRAETPSISSQGMTEDEQEKMYRFYRLSARVELSCANAANADMPMTVSSAEEEEQDSMACCLLVKVKDDSTGEYIYQTKLYYENESTRLLEEVSTSLFPSEKLAGKSFTMTVDAVCEVKGGTLTAASLAPRTINFKNAVAQSFINKITVTDPRWQNGKQQGSIVFLYGRKSYGAVKGDYVGGHYLQNRKGHNLRTIIPIRGIIELNSVRNIIGVSIDSYEVSNGKFPKSCLDYAVSGGKVIAEHGGSIKLEDLGGVLQRNGDLTYDSKSNTASFDLKLPVKGSMLGPYDWDYSLSNAFLDDSSHTCYLTGCFVLRIEHEPYMGMTVDQYAIFIYSVPRNPGQKIVYYESGEGETNVFIPPIEIYWGCFAKDTQIKTADGSTKRADQIGTGDQIPALGGKTLTVTDILTGEDPEIIRIVTEDGKRIRVSGGHAMLVSDDAAPEGRHMAAARLQAGDRLMTPDGVSVISEVVTEPYNDMVYNFIFEGEEKPNYIEADGFWSGDFYAQNEKKKKKAAQLTEEAAALRDELRKFAEA